MISKFKKREEAILFEKAVDKGEFKSMSKEEAAQFFKKAAELGESESMGSFMETCSMKAMVSK